MAMSSRGPMTSADILTMFADFSSDARSRVRHVPVEDVAEHAPHRQVLRVLTRNKTRESIHHVPSRKRPPAVVAAFVQALALVRKIRAAILVQKNRHVYDVPPP